ncbi:MAG TPA: extracellular solute-binding protein, partial [Tepidisphaeraceae bacterium]|nr:extracellular solute-binding protein [Tepidisphaeraceae bacterium]
GRARPPRNAEQFLQAAAAIRKDLDGDGRADIWGFGFGHWRYNFMSLAPQFGGRYVNEQGEPTLDHPGNIAALQFLADLNLKHRLAPPPEGGIAGWVGFRQQRVAMVFDGIYMLGDLKRLEGHPYRAAPIPQIGPQPGAFADSHILCIRKGLSPARRAAAARFIRFLTDHSLEWADAGQIPARSSVRQSSAFAELTVQYEFSRQLDYVMYPPKTPSISEFFLHLDAAVEKAIRGRATAAEALRQANLDFKRYLDRDRMERALLADRQAEAQGVRP